jgi:hypothetical protein
MLNIKLMSVLPCDLDVWKTSSDNGTASETNMNHTQTLNTANMQYESSTHLSHRIGETLIDTYTNEVDVALVGIHKKRG